MSQEERHTLEEWVAMEVRRRAAALPAHWFDSRYGISVRDLLQLPEPEQVATWEAEGGALKYDWIAQALEGPYRFEPPWGEFSGQPFFSNIVDVEAAGPIDAGQLVVLGKDGKARQAASLSGGVIPSGQVVISGGEDGEPEAVVPAPKVSDCRHCGDTIENDDGWYHVNDVPVPFHVAEPRSDE